MTEEQQERRIRNCKHCFALIKEGEWWCGFHSSDSEYEEPVIECVKCGLTNKDKRLYKKLSFRFREPPKSRLFGEIVYNHKHSRVPFAIEDLNMLSMEKIGTRVPQIFYSMAKEVNLDIDINNPDTYPLIVKTMQKLIQISKDNNINPSTLEACYKIIDIYDGQKVFNREIK